MDDWVLDSLMGFLQSPVWSHPINSFIDSHCVVFDPGEENKFSYTDVHKEYQKKVEGLLEEFTSELGITTDQFTQACSQLLASKAGQSGQDSEDLFEHVLAADDFLVFKSVMVRRNIELELRALERLKIEMGLQPVAYRSGEENGMGAHDKASSQPNPEDEKTLSDVLKKSEEEYKLKCSMDEEELQKLIELVKAESLQLYKQNLEKKGNEVATEVLERDKKSEQQEPPCEAGSEGKKEREEGGMLNTATKVNSELVKGEAKEIESLPQKIEKKSLEQPLPNPQIVQPGQRDSVHNAVPQSLSGAEAAEMWLEKAKSDLHLTDSNTSSAHSLRTSSGPSPEQLKAREDYLKQQRDHLLKAKRQAQGLHSGSRDSAGLASSSRRTGSAQTPPTTRDGGGTRNKNVGQSHHCRGLKDTGILSSVIAGSLKRKQQKK